MADTDNNNQPDTDRAPKKERMSMYIDPELAGRIRTAAPFAMAFGKHNSMSEWIGTVIEREVRAIENKVNDGQPFQPSAPGEALARGPAVHPTRRNK
jgi:hypothetical protein